MPSDDLNSDLDAPPSLARAMQAKAAAGLSEASFAEDRDPALTPMDEVSPIKAKMATMKDMPASERASMGSKIGAAIGGSTNGDHGAVIGSAAGAYAGRALGLVQSGEHQDGVRMARVASTLLNMGIVDESGAVTLENGEVLPMLYPGDERLPNINSAVKGKDRAPFEIDKSNPLTNRTTTVARPLARFLASGLLKYNNDRSVGDVRALDRTTGLIVNALQTDATNIGKVYERAQALTKKFGVTENDLRGYFNSIKGQLSEKETADIKKGLEILFSGSK